MDATERYVATATAAVDELLRLQPEKATDLGLHDHDDRLDDYSDDGERALRAHLVASLDALDTVDLGALSLDDAVDAEILRVGLDQELLLLDQVRDRAMNPLAWLPGDALFPLVVRDTVPVPVRLRSLAGRLAGVPDRLALARRTVERPSRIHVETAIGQVTGQIGLVGEISGLLEQEPGLRSLVEPLQQQAVTALETHRAFLTDQLETADGDPTLTAELFAAKLHLTLDSDLSAAEIVRLAWQNMDEVNAALRDLVGGDDDAVRAAFAECGRSAPTDDTILAMCRQSYAEAVETVQRLGLATVPAEMAEVVVMPESRRGVAVAYCDSPGALETGGVTFYAVSPTPADWSAERAASFYREYNSAMVVNLSVHEAMPGHVLQIDHSRRWRGSTPVRHVFRSGSFVEGWAVHAERIMAEAGHGGVPVRLQQLKMQLRTTANAIIDAGVHGGGMTEAEAMALMMGRAFQEEGEAVGKWRRAQMSSCQLSTYFVGYAELVPVLAGRSTFDPVLAHGSPPPRHLARLLASS